MKYDTIIKYCKKVINVYLIKRGATNWKIRKTKIIVSITIGIMCFILVFTMYIQFNTIERTDLANVATMREAELREELAKWNSRYEELKLKYDEEAIKKQEYQDSLGTDVEASNLIEQELKETNILLGLTDVTGPGIEVTLTDNETKDIDAYDLLELVNELRLAGAEAISINEEKNSSNVRHSRYKLLIYSYKWE